MVTGKIKGGINELVELLQDNKAKSWKLVYDEDKPASATVFISDDKMPRESEIDRMVKVLNKTSISRCVVIMQPEGKGDQDRCNQLKYEFSTAETQPAGGVGALPVQSGYSREDVERMVSEGVERAMLKHRLEELEADRKDFEREKREFEARQNGAIGQIGNLLFNALQQRKPHLAVAGLEQPDTAQDESEVVVEGAKESEDVPTQENQDAKRLADALKRYAEYDEDYIDVICKLVDVVTSGQTIGGLPYSTVKNLLMQM